MDSTGLPFLITVFLWWFSTGAILLVVGLPRTTRYWSFAGAMLAAAFAVYGLFETRDSGNNASAYIAFCCALVLWGANEVGFLLGLITGARKTAAPHGASRWMRFTSAAQSILHHEVALALTAGGIALCLWGSKNQIGLHTFLILWGMRLSTKFNIFLGVPNITVQFLPAHLLYLKQFFANKPMNLLFPFSITASTLLAAILINGVMQAPPGSFEAVGYALLASLAVLGVLEHWFLVIPLPFGDLWAWGLAGREKRTQTDKYADEMSPPHVQEKEHLYKIIKDANPENGLKPLEHAVKKWNPVFHKKHAIT